jgi:hypothetical protein
MEKNALTAREIEILSILCRKAQWKNVFTERYSDRDFDVHIFAEDGIENRWKIASSMYLAIIKSVNWKDKRIWGLNDAYGDKGSAHSQRYDWSGILYSSLDAIWEMTGVAVVMLEEEDFSSCQQKKIDDAVKTLGVMFSMFETKEELVEYVVKRQDSFITHMAAAYMILTDMV